MELTWPIKLRIIAAVLAGIMLIGFLAWPLTAAGNPFAPVMAANISFVGAAILTVLAFAVGFLAAFLSRPWGRQIGILAVPAGLSIWAVRSGNVASLLQMTPAVSQRQEIFAQLRWGAIFWIWVVAAGWLGVLAAQKIFGEKDKPSEEPPKSGPTSNMYVNIVIAVVASVLLAQFFLELLAKDVVLSDGRLGIVIGQPAVGQIIFAVAASFGAAAFLVKKFFNMSYIWPVLACAVVTVVATSRYVNPELLKYLVGHWPAAFLNKSVLAVLPVQMVAFGTLGAVLGYWLAVRYNYWRKHEGS